MPGIGAARLGIGGRAIHRATGCRGRPRDYPDGKKPGGDVRRILRLLRERPLALDALMHAEAGSLIECLFESRQTERAAGLKVPHFFRCFQKAMGSTPINFLRRERISQANRRLVESPDSVREIAEQVGYSDQFYFSRDFKRYTGMSPTRFRKRELGLEAELRRP